MTLAEIQARLEAAGNADIAADSARFLRTGPGEYGEGDQFQIIRAPVLRKLPRTMLRYAIERFDEKTRKEYLEGRV